jgi:hypothetical protein
MTQHKPITTGCTFEHLTVEYEAWLAVHPEFSSYATDPSDSAAANYLAVLSGAVPSTDD